MSEFAQMYGMLKARYAERAREIDDLRAQLAEAHAVVRDLLVVIEQYPSCQRTVIARCRCLSCSIPRAWELLKSDAAQQPAGGAE